MVMQNSENKSPYNLAAASYFNNGWLGVLPLPINEKWPPPSGYTGKDAPDPSAEQIYEWILNAKGNICLRLPKNVIGLDVDAYKDKTGGQTLMQLEQDFGILPETWRVTSRNDGTSGIRLFKIPENLAWPSIAGPGIEIIRNEHRYAVVWPSIHPEGGTYRWINPAGTDVIGAGPNTSELPELPQTWIIALTQGKFETSSIKKQLTPMQTNTMLEAVKTNGQPCERVTNEVHNLHRVLSGSEGSRHDATLPIVMRLVSLGARGHHGVANALDVGEQVFTTMLSSERGSHYVAANEWRNMVTGALAKISDYRNETCRGSDCAKPQQAPLNQFTPVIDLPLYDEETGEIIDEPMAQISRRDLLLATEIETQAVRREAKKLLDDEQILKTFRAPEILGNLSIELQQPDEQESYLINELFPTGANVVLTAAFKSGKTTMMNQLVKSLIDDEPFLGRYGVQPHDGNIVIFNYEVDKRQYRQWMREVGIRNQSKVYLVHLRGLRMPLTTKHIEDKVVEILGNLNAQTWVIDPYARAFTGSGEENSNSDVGVFLDTLDIIKDRAGVQNLIMPAHTGRAQEQGIERARGATRLDDWADVRWLLNKNESGERFFSATGRDVEVAEQLLTWSEVDRSLRIERSIGKHDRTKERVMEALIDYVKANQGCMTKDIDTNVKGHSSDLRKAKEDAIGQGLIRVESDGTSKKWFTTSVQKWQANALFA
jgi:hypothetical protein